MRVEDFIDKVALMRSLQKEYDQMHNEITYIYCKNVEREVDKDLEEYKKQTRK